MEPIDVAAEQISRGADADCPPRYRRRVHRAGEGSGEQSSEKRARRCPADREDDAAGVTALNLLLSLLCSQHARRSQVEAQEGDDSETE
jgi:hypothetical protein